MLGTAWSPNSARYATIPETERDAKGTTKDGRQAETALLLFRRCVREPCRCKHGHLAGQTTDLPEQQLIAKLTIGVVAPRLEFVCAIRVSRHIAMHE